MKKILCMSLLILCQSSLAINPACSGGAFNNWNNNTVTIYDRGWSWQFWHEIKFCALNNKVLIKYSIDDLLTGRNQPGGKNIPMNRASVQLNPTTIRPSGIVNVSDIPAEALSAPPYYLQKNNNTKNNPSGNLGLFRFFTQIGYGYAGCNDWPSEKYGYQHIRKYWMASFFSKLRVNGLGVVGSTSNGSFAKATDVLLTKPGSTMKADVYFYEGRNKQKSASRRICVVDVYAKLVLKPESSPDFKKSGVYDLQFEMAP